MEIYLLRHGKAEDAAPGMSDRDRRLTPEGIVSMKSELPGIKKHIPRLDRVLTSPYPRAEETARIAATAFGLESSVEQLDALAAAAAEKEIVQKLSEFPDGAAVMLVGHSPLLEELAEYLIGPGHEIILKKGGLAKITFREKPSRDNGSLEWCFKPKELKAKA